MRKPPSRLKCHDLLQCAGFLLLGLAASVSHAEPIAIVGAAVIHPELDGPEAVAADTTVIISGSRILAVGPAQSPAAPKDANVIDGRGKWVIPGLIDSHIHFFQSGNLYTRPDIADFGGWMPFAREVARNKARIPATFKVWLASGVTGVVDVGGPFWNFQVRDAAAKADAAPRVAISGPLVATVARPQLDLGDPPIIMVTSADAARALVRQELEYNPDFVKVWFIHSPGDDLLSQEAIVKVAGDMAHAAGRRLAVHATELAVAKAALRAGADFLVHSVEDQPLDEAFFQLARQNHALYCPTLFVHLGYEYALSNTWRPTEAEKRLADPRILASMSDLDRIPHDRIPENVLSLLNRHPVVRPSPIALGNLRAAWNAGITVVMGTDAGNIGTLPGPSVFREMDLMVRAGLTPLQVLRSATVNGAKALGKENETGTISPGKLADLVILEADPLADVSHLSRIYRVIKDGKIFDPDELIRSIR